VLDQRILNNFPFKRNYDIIVAGYVGSVSHGTSNPDPTGLDDVDIMGAVIPPLPFLLGIDRFEQWDPRVDENSNLGELDCVFYDIRKLVNLWLKSNPNVLSLLWLKDEFYIREAYEFRAFKLQRKRFSSKAGYHAIKGYAYGQMKDMDKGVYKGYMGAKRKALVEKFGYDTKHASHLIRLLRMGVEYCTTGEYRVWRGDIDAEELKEIKNGAWPRDKVLREADYLMKELTEAHEKSPLPEQADVEWAKATLLDVLTDYVRVEVGE
jgi:predicted nucleotidyltransferase